MISYIAAPKYRIVVTADNFKIAEKCNEIHHLFRKLLNTPTLDLEQLLDWSTWRHDTKPAPKPPITADRQPNSLDHELRLEY